MFTGLVETRGIVQSLVAAGESARLTIAAPLENLELGESIAVNGCCLTVTAFGPGEVSFDVLAQTLRVTALGQLQSGDTVNLERAMQANARVGGHFVLGHVDCVGEVLAYDEAGQDHRWEVAVPRELLKYCIDKGSLAVDGMSLTIAEISEGRGSVVFWITPHTHAVTNLVETAAGKKVNLEVDMLAKYVERLLAARES